MSSETPKVSDRVRFTIDAEYIRPSVNDKVSDHLVLAGAGDEYTLPYEAAIEILERADDPARDPVGTVRENKGSYKGVYVKTAEYEGREWFHVVEGFFTCAPYTIGGIVGAVPGTPADKAAEVEPEYEPFRVTADSPEPDRSRTYVDHTGIKWARLGGGWQYLIRSRREWNGTPFTWDEIRFGGRVRPDFPWHVADGD